MLLAWLGCLWATSGIRLEANGQCPTSAEVEARLAPLLASTDRSADGKPARTATLVEEAGGLTLRLTEADGAVVAEKRLAADPTPSCTALAETVAVVVATWEGRLRSGVALAIESPLVPPRSPAPAVVSTRASPRAAAPASRGADLFAGLYLDAGASAPAVKGGARIGRTTGLAAQLSLAAVGPVRDDLAGGQTRWGRFALGLGPAWSLGTGSWRGRFAIEGTFGLLIADGIGYSQTQSRMGIDGGGAAGGSVGRRFGSVTPWVGLELYGWLRQHQLTVAGASEAIRVPRLQTWLGAGVSWSSIR